MAGVWRIQRNNPRGKRHTISCTVAIVETTVDLAYATLDVREVDETTYRASGAGGQHRNKTDSAVRLVHRPTGTIVRAERSRSQHQNREAAWTELARRLDTIESARRHDETNRDRVAQITRVDSRDWTWNEKAGTVTRRADGRSWPIRTFVAGKADLS